MTFHYTKTQGAQDLIKVRESDSGYDLTLISKVKQIDSRTAMYDSGISVQPPPGFYFDLVARSSIYKHGYILHNGIGIIDNEYRGTIKVVLTKMDEATQDLELPIRLCQLIPREVKHLEAVAVQSLSDSDRGIGGFGSTGEGFGSTGEGFGFGGTGEGTEGRFRLEGTEGSGRTGVDYYQSKSNYYK